MTTDPGPASGTTQHPFGHRQPRGDLTIYGGSIGVSLESGRADGLLLLGFDNGYGHPATWHFTRDEAAALRDLISRKLDGSERT